MNVGFTGTRTGMTHKQIVAFTALIKDLAMSEFHHGDCLGADAQAHAMVRDIKPGAATVIHPPSNSSSRAWCTGDILRPTDDYLLRNKAIVNETKLLIATPNTARELQRSGTWATIRYARKMKKQIIILEP